jgi:ABC-type Fe3+-hydroxamate transport system substrate-binding protein
MEFTDQMHRKIELSKWPPQRIVSLVPSQTELLFDLGLGEKVVGITKFCTHPNSWFRTKTRIGGTKTVDFTRIAALAPDLILGNKEENDRHQIEELTAHFPVWMSDISTLEHALDMITEIGKLTDSAVRAAKISEQILTVFSEIKPVFPTKRVAYFIWRKPYMVAGGDTFIQNMLEKVGFLNVFAEKLRYPEVSAAAISAANLDLILLSDEPFPFKEKHLAEFRAICPTAEIRIIDGEMCSWYGSRLQLFDLKKLSNSTDF